MPVFGGLGGHPPEPEQGDGTTGSTFPKMMKPFGLGGIKSLGDKIKIDIKWVEMIPFLVLGFTALSSLVRMLDGYNSFYFFASMIIGGSLATGVVFLALAEICRFRVYSIISIVSLMILNVIAMLTVAIGFKIGVAYFIADGVICLAMFLLALNKYLSRDK